MGYIEFVKAKKISEVWWALEKEAKLRREKERERIKRAFGK